MFGRVVYYHPCYSTLYSEEIFQNAISDPNIAIKVNGIYVNNIRFADDTTLIADSLNGIQNLLDRVNQFGKEAGLVLR